MNEKVYKVVTDKIIETLQNGEIPWEKPWVTKSHRNLKTGHVYRGINRLMTAFSKFNSPYWLTFNQIRDLKGKLKKGSKGTPVVFWKFLEKEQTDGTKKTIPLCRYYTVFNIEQVEGLDHLIPTEETFDWEPIEKAQEIVEACKFASIINHDGGSAAYYSPMTDSIHLPVRESFKTAEGYFNTTYHEMAHATGHITRLNRNLLAGHFGNHEYSKEELVAELTAAFLCEAAGINNKKEITNSAAYIQSWIKALKNDVSMIISAASKAEKAAKYILGESVEENDDQSDE